MKTINSDYFSLNENNLEPDFLIDNYNSVVQYYFEAHCFSPTCLKRPRNQFGKVKYVPKFQEQCPDCGYYLNWIKFKMEG